MKAKDVKRLLRISSPTLVRYVQNGKVKTHEQGNGQYDYDDDVIYDLLNNNKKRKTICLYRIGSRKDIDFKSYQLMQLENYCNRHNIQNPDYLYIPAHMADVRYDELIGKLVEDILKFKIKRIVVTSMGRLSTQNLSIFETICKACGVTIISLNDELSQTMDRLEIETEAKRMIDNTPKEL